MSKELPKKQLTRAEIYAESVLTRMKENPGSCDLFDELIPHLGNNPIVTVKGFGGGVDFATNYLQKLFDIHKPHCKMNVQHNIFL